MTWSGHSRRIEPTSHSTYGFCQGARGPVITSSIPAFRHGGAVFAIDRIAIAQQISRRLVPGKRFPDLLHGPLLRWVFRHPEVQHAASSMRQHDKDKQNPERHGWHREKVDRAHLLHMIRQNFR
jgi:hypothetical protein